MNPRIKTPHQGRIELLMVGAGQIIPRSPVMPVVAIRYHRARLILEEALETIEALGFLVTASPRFRSSAVLGSLSTDQHETTLYSTVDPPTDLAKIVDGCGDLSVVSIGTMSACGVADHGVLCEIDRANLTKFIPPICSSCEIAMVQEPTDHDEWKCSKGCPNTLPHTAGPYKENGKWIKPPYFKPPDVERVIREQLDSVASDL